MAADSGGNSEDGELFSLKEFTECFDLPEWVEIVGGNDAGPAHPTAKGVQKGMIVMLRTLAVDYVTLSFNDIETGSKRIAKVSPNSQVKFKILLPFPDFKNPKEQRTVYQTVADLLTVCPTYFKSNIPYDDPYLPAIVKSGEVFRFIRQIKGKTDRRLYLQCEDADGNIIELPAECRGDFIAVDDEKSYSLQEILELGIVDRKLKLSREHMKLSVPGEQDDHVYGNVSVDKSLQTIMGLPLTYSGMLTFHCPEMFLVTSPSDNIQEMWKVPLDLDIQVKHFKTEQYESPAGSSGANSSPVCKVFKLSELLDTFHEEFPVRATLVHYKDMPEEFGPCLEPGCDVVIHGIERYDRILAKSGDMHFVISKDMTGRFRKTLRRVDCMEDLRLIHPEGDEVTVKVLQDVASDFPIPFSLQTGDVLRFKTLKTKMHKIKRKSKSYGQFPVFQCERKTGGQGTEKILLPEDLEICLHEMPPISKMDGFSADDVFRFKPELPFNVDYLADYLTLWSCLPISSEICLSNFVTEALALVSVVSRSDDSKHIDPRIRDLLLVPARHHMMLTVKECLGFPPSYFVYPDRRTYISSSVEKISKQAYEDLIRHNDMAYEDYDGEKSPQSSTGDVQLPTKRRTKHGEQPADVETLNKRLSRSLGTMFNSTKGFKAGLMNKLRKEKKSDPSDSPSGSSLAVENSFYGTQASSSDGDTYDDENIYESVNVPGHR